jgi:hypothetical protein
VFLPKESRVCPEQRQTRGLDHSAGSMSAQWCRSGIEPELPQPSMRSYSPTSPGTIVSPHWCRLVVTQEGPENYHVYRHASEEAARTQARRLWCCWVLFEHLQGGALSEKASGGVGPQFLILPAIRTWAAAKFKTMARDNDARSGAAAAAEARAAAAAKRAPPPKPKATVVGGSDGKPDVSNPVVWD